MSADGRTCDYDGFAQIYDRHWGPRNAAAATEMLECILFPRIPPEAKILDLCCGAGHVSAVLGRRGFDVVGLDLSRALVDLAKTNAPRSRFEVADARAFTLGEKFDAVISLSDSLNHIMTADEMQAVFRNVHGCLAPGGTFLFDLNLPRLYERHWDLSFSMIDSDAVCAVVRTVEIERRIARFSAAVFHQHDGRWVRRDVELLQTWFPPEELAALLDRTGFTEIRITDRRGADIDDGNAERAYFSCKKPLTLGPARSSGPDDPRCARLSDE